MENKPFTPAVIWRAIRNAKTSAKERSITLTFKSEREKDLFLHNFDTVLKEFARLEKMRDVDLDGIKSAIQDIIWMARRYADGRRSYAVDMFNRAQKVLTTLVGADVIGKPDPVLEGRAEARRG